MTNKQTIDGVSREAVEAILGLKKEGFVAAWKELRALLDASDECKCKRYGKDNPHWPCPIHSKPSAQPQGEIDPVCAQIRFRLPEKGCHDWGDWHDLKLCCFDQNRTHYIDSAGWECETRALYADQPSHSGNANEMVAKVVLPERMYSDSLPSWAEEQKLVRGWNACLDEVAKLNGLKP